jgi:xanthine dehydrogenase small subunit
LTEFILNFKHRCVKSAPADRTLLDYLRLDAGLSGSKEGCASGDCGACTVSIATAGKKGKLEYQNVNSCICFLGSVHGKHVITVDAITPPGTSLGDVKQLHPVQQAMVDFHASQCGFCTPGFVMTLFTMVKNHRAANRESVNHALSGNLCRCTGYRPISDAAIALLNHRHEDEFDQKASQTLAQLADIPASPGDGNYLLPQTEQQLQDAIASHPEAILVAGATDLALEVTQNLRRLPALIDLSEAKELQQIDVQDQRLSIGATVSYRECTSALIKAFPEMKVYLERLGSEQIRNRGTLGGNIANASPIGDMPPALIALGASLEIGSANGSREIPLDTFFLAYKQTTLAAGEYLRAVHIPLLEESEQFKLYKISKRFDDDISAISFAARVSLKSGRIKDIRIALGGMDAIARRALATEQAMRGNTLGDTTLRTAQKAIAGEFSPLSDVRASARYRSQISVNLCSRLFMELQQVDHATQIQHV